MKILDQKKILICNLAKGKLGEDTSEVLGIMIVANILVSIVEVREEGSDNKNSILYVC